MFTGKLHCLHYFFLKLYFCLIFVDTKAARAGSMQQEDTQTSQQQAINIEEEHQKITEYEDMFKVIKEATGVSDTQVSQIKNQMIR